MATPALDLRETPEGVLLRVKAVPAASRDRISGILGGTLKVQIAAPPEKGRANQALIRVLATALGIPARSIHVHQGASTPRKVVLICGLSGDQVRARLGTTAAGS